MAGKQWMKTRPGHVALAALAWTILGLVFALPDLSAGTEWRHALLLSLTLWWSWASGGTVIVSAHRDGNRLEIRVLDDGVGLPAGWTLANSGGVGLSVTRQRVAGLYPAGATCFAVNRRANGGTEVEISLPLRWTGKDADAAIRV